MVLVVVKSPEEDLGMNPWSVCMLVAVQFLDCSQLVQLNWYGLC